MGERFDDLPAKRLDPRVKAVWRLSDGLWITVMALLLEGGALVLGAWEETHQVGTMLATVFALVIVALYLVFLVVLPPLRYARWRYEVSQDYLRITKGIIWRKRCCIPFIRVQNTDSRQGPLLRAFHLASVTVSTAAQEHSIPGLDVAQADQLRDRAAELARLAREDV